MHRDFFSRARATLAAVFMKGIHSSARSSDEIGDRSTAFFRQRGESLAVGYEIGWGASSVDVSGRSLISMSWIFEFWDPFDMFL